MLIKSATGNTDADVMRLLSRFDERVETIPESSCWWWTGGKGPRGYGAIGVGKERWLAHRLSYVIHNGVHPMTNVVMHSCDNPACVNPDHLSLGSHGDNVRDKVAKGRQPKGESHSGHKLTDAQVKEIRASSERGYILAKQYGVSQSHISLIRSGKARKSA